MKREDVVIALLAGTSVVLVVLIALSASGHGPLLAQSVDRSNGFVLVAGQFDQNRDALFLLDERSGQVAIFTSTRGSRDVRLAEVRDLRSDFGIRVETPPEERPFKEPR